jgi:hypothetical protein
VNRRRIVRRILFGLLALVVIAAAGMAWVIGPSNIIGMLRYDTRREGDFKVGDRAPDVALARLDGSGEQRLSALIGDKPLVIVFGSFT